jgi:hypothetical protein
MGHHRGLLIMKSIFITILMGGIMLLLSSCATVPTDPLTSGELRLLSMHIPERESLKENLPVVVNINFEADGKPQIRSACFYWSGDGPYCSKVTNVYYGQPGTIHVQIRAQKPGSYTMESYVMYFRDGKTQPTNVISSRIRVVP